MGIDLLATYENLIQASTTSQTEVNESAGKTACISQFLSPDLYVTVRANLKGPRSKELKENGHVCVFADKNAIAEMLGDVSNLLKKSIALNSQVGASQRSFLISQCVMLAVNKYFGEPVTDVNEMEKKRDSQYAYNKTTYNSEAKLSDFKGKGYAKCVEKSLATCVCFQVLQNDEFIRQNNLFPYEVAYHRTDVASNIRSSVRSGGHAICLLCPKHENVHPMILVDPAIVGKIEQKGKVQPTLGIYELTGDDVEALKNNRAFSPQLMCARHIAGIKQTSHRAYGPSYELRKLHLKVSDMEI